LSKGGGGDEMKGAWGRLRLHAQVNSPGTADIWQRRWRWPRRWREGVER
jgi:hypothetical protein